MKVQIAFALVFALSAPAAAQTGATAPKAQSPAERAFERLKALEGEWDGKSTKGWTDTVSFLTIAAGSVVMSRSFDAHPNETMITMHHMDGADLILTHYCVAKNQPRLKATSISPDLRTIEFTFRDGTNLASRDRGHMDRVVMRFIDDDHFTSQWTWYQAGKEEWMELIEYVRHRPRASNTSAPACHPSGT